MKNLLACFIIMLISFSANGQISRILCGFESPPFTQSNNPIDFQVSDASPFGSTSNAQFVYDDFEIDEDTGVDAICLVGRFEFNPPDAARENIGTRDIDDCTPGNLYLAYFEDNGSDEPGDMIMSFDISPDVGLETSNGLCGITLAHSTVNFPVGKYWFTVSSGQDANYCDLELAYDNLNPPVRENDNTRAITQGFLVEDIIGNRVTQGFGSGLNFALRAAPLAPIPTMGQWGIMVLGLCFLIIGRLYIKQANTFLVS